MTRGPASEPQPLAAPSGRFPHVYQGLAADPATLTFAQLAGVLDPTSRVAFLWQR